MAKLIKVAKDFNVGLHTIVETLRNKGFSKVEDKPTAEITDEMLTVLQKEFQRDLAIKQEADKLLRPTLKKDPVEATAPELPKPAVLPRLGPLPTREPAPKAEPTPTTAPKEDAVDAVVPRERLALRVVGKIDLNPPKPVQQQPKREEKPRVDNRPPQRDTVKPATPSEDKKAPEQPIPVVVKEERPAPPVAPSVPAQVAPPSDSGADVPGEPELIRADAHQLRGLKVLGKINLETRSEDNSRGGTRGRGGRERGRSGDRPAGGGGANRPAGDRPAGDRAGGANRAAGDRPAGDRQGGANRPAGDRQGGANRAAGPGGANRPAGDRQGGANRAAGPGGANRPAGEQPQGQAGSNADRQRRKRKTVGGQPITAESLQASMSGNQGGDRSRGGSGGGANRPAGDRSPRAGTRPAPGAVSSFIPKEVSQKDIENQIKQTMARMGAGASRKRQKIRRDKRSTMRVRAEQAEIANDQSGVLQVTEFVSVSDLASLMNIKPADVIKACMSLGIFVGINQRIDAEIIEVVASEFGFEVQFISAEEQVEVEEELVDDPADLRVRQPIVTVMGHVDHGKTSLLDFIRSANVAQGEAGGITQHIGAYEVVTEVGGEHRKITFLDTPGHEAFTAMRARGAKVTDIAIILVAADDNIMPQTREAISHAQAANVPIVFAINKIDKPGADPERIKNELAQMNLLVEDWGGKIPSQDISAKKGTNIDKLLEKVVLESELLDLHANPKRRALGTVLEASMEKGRGYVTKILIENGTLRKGDPIIAGEFAGKVKAMFNERGIEVKEAGPAVPVLVLGLPGAPQAGEKIKVAASDSEAKQIATKRSQIIREQANRANKRISLEEIGRRLALGNFKELKLIVKGDVDGSVEALSDSLIKLSMEKIQVSVIHKAVGQIVDSDIMLASASDAIIIGFQVRPSLTARKLAEKEGVEIKTYSIIYEAIDEIRAAMEGMLEPTKEEEIMGQVEIRDVFKITKVGTVAGCYVQEGKISRNHNIRLIRDGIVVYPVNANQHAELSSLKRFKEDAKEVRAGLECGLTIKNFNDMKVGDVVEAYIINEVKATL